MMDYTATGATATGENWRDNYRTPPEILDRVRLIWPDYFDPFPIAILIPLPEPWDGFSSEWDSCAFINPPFSKYKQAVQHGLTQPTEQIWLSHTNHDTSWWKALFEASSAVCLLHKRVKFIDPRNGIQTRSTAIGKCQSVFYRGDDVEAFARAFEDIGFIVVSNNR